MESPLVSIIIDNYNYERYVSAAVRSALQQTYRRIEVIVVDDGSTDNSRNLLRKFEQEVTLIFQKNGGQAAAFNTGFARSRGDIVMFLDSDDELLPSAVDEVVSHWKECYSKLQFPLAIVDVEGRPNGLSMPRLPVSEGNLIPAFLKTGRYVASPTSGNAFSRTFLNQVMPIPELEWAKTADGYLNNCVPFYGEIGVIRKQLAYYRVHGQSMSSVINRQGKLNLEVARQLMRNGLREKELIEEIATRKHLAPARDIVVSHWMFLKLKLALAKASSGRGGTTGPLYVMKTALQMVASAARSPEVKALKKVQYAAWASAVALLPWRSAERIVRFGFETAPPSGVLRAVRR